MDSVDLLAREEEFKKLNKQLEKKSISLMKEIEHNMQKQDIFAEFSPSLILNNYKTNQHSCKSSKNNTPEWTPKKCNKKESVTKQDAKSNQKRPEISSQRDEKCTNDVESKDSDSTNTNFEIPCNCCIDKNNTNLMEFLQAFISVNVQTNVLPKNFLKDKIGIESVCKFLSSKVKLMEEQIDKLQATIDRKVGQCENHLKQIAEYESERLQLLNKANNTRAENSELKAKIVAMQNRLNEKERLYKEQRTESDKTASEVKRLRSKNANVEARCVTMEEEIERLKGQVEGMKTAEKEYKSAARNVCMSHTNAISALEAKVKAMKTTIDNQNALIDNLRKQNSLLSLDVAVKILERDYVDFLNKD